MTAAGLGARPLLVERSRTGGDCLWTGCVPSKTLLSAADHATTMRALTGQEPDYTAVRERIFSAIQTIAPVDSIETLEASGVKVIKGSLVFRAPGVAEVDGKQILFLQPLIATGGEPDTTTIPGLDLSRVVTSETVWELDALPKRLAIVGDGPIACELGQAFARLGSQVTMVFRGGILPKEDPDAADTVLMAIGRVPRTANLGLDLLGVNLDSDGQIVTDTRMRTSNPHIWAAGDVSAHPQLTHLAGAHATVAAANAVLGINRRISPTVPHVTFTSPEVAAVGLTAADTLSGHLVRTVFHTHVDRGVAEDNTRGFSRLIVDRRGKILDGTIVGSRAGESLSEVTLAVQKGMKTADIAGTTHLVWARRRWLSRTASYGNSASDGGDVHHRKARS